jgi:hypothetical protein
VLILCPKFTKTHLRASVVQKIFFWLADARHQGREGKGREGKGREGKGREGKGREGKGREGKGREGKGREGKGREGKGREGKGGTRRYIYNTDLTTLLD